ncbi:MAG: phosphoribosylglycinamide formyltransferase [Thermoleophilaceae bacterium]
MSFPIAVLVSGEGSNLQAILDTVHGREGIEVVCVGSSRAEARGLERARAAGIEAEAFEISALPGRDERDVAMGDWLEEHGVELIVRAGFMELLGSPFIRRFEGRIVNVHPSLLPAFPGVGAIEQALAHGVKLIGVTVHFVDEDVDSGPIVLQESIELPYARTTEEVEGLVHEVEHRLLPRAIRLIASGAVGFDPDNPRLVRVEEEAGGDG